MTVRARQAAWVWAVLLAAAMALPNLIITGSWVGATVGLLTLIVIVVLLAQTVTQRLVLVWQLLSGLVAGEVVLTCGIVHLLAPELAPLGFLPRWRALVASDRLLATAVAGVNAAVPPVRDTALFAPLAMLVIGHLAVLTAVVAIVGRWTAWVGVAAVAPWAVACTLRLDAGWGWAVIAAVVYLGMLAWDSTSFGTVRRPPRAEGGTRGWGRAAGPASAGPGLMALVIAVVVGMVVALAAPALPGWASGGRLVSTLRGTGKPGGIGDISNIGVGGAFDLNAQLGDPDQGVVLRVKGDYTGAMKLYSLDEFNGTAWLPPESSSNVNVVLGQPLWPSAVQTGWQQGGTLRIDLTGWSYQYLPIALGPRSVDVDTPILGDYQPDADAVVLSTGLMGGLPQEVDEQTSVLDTSQLTSLMSYDGVSSNDYTPLPLPHDDQLAALAQQIVSDAGATSPDAELNALVAYLGSSHFRYTLNPDVDPTSHDPVWDFISRGTGYCVHFATALVAMGRALGIPMRVGVGYAGGTVDADGWRSFTAADAHMWAEASLDGVGWVPYEATKAGPGVAQTATPSASAPSETDSESALPTLSNSASAPSVAPSSSQPAATVVTTAGRDATDAWLIVTFLLAALVVVVAVRLFPPEHTGIEAVWGDVVTRARSSGLVTPGMTPRQVWASVRPRLAEGPPRQAWDDLVRALEAERYRSPRLRGSAPTAEQLHAWRRRLLRALGHSSHEG